MTATASASEALKALELLKVDVLVSDIGMPGADGYALIRQVRLEKQFRNLPAVALTTYASESYHAKFLDTGFQMHLPKPVEPSKLVAIVAQLTRQTEFV